MNKVIAVYAVFIVIVGLVLGFSTSGINPERG
jgi:hypothetical protein